MLALGLRLFGLDRKSVWYDEAMSAWFAGLDLPSLLDAVTREANPPLYYLLLHVWLPLGHGDAWLRLPSVLFGTLAAVAALQLGRTLFGHVPGLLAGLLTAIAPFQVDVSQEARAYALLSLLATTSLLLLWQAIQHGGWRWPAHVLVTTLALYTHYYAFFLLAAETMYLVGLQLAQRSRTWQPWAALGAILLLFLPWTPAFVRQLGLSGGYWIPPPYQGLLWDTYAAFIAYTPPAGPAAEVVLKLGRWLILGLLALSALSAIRRPRVLLPVLAVVSPILGALLLSVWLAPLYLIRYLAYVVPAFWVVVARGADVLPAPVLRWAVVSAVVCAVALNLPSLYAEPTYGRSDFRAAADLVRRSAQPGDLVVHTRGFSEAPFSYYLGSILDQVLLPENDQAALREAVQSRPRFWYVRDYGLLDPSEGAGAISEAQAYLREWSILEEHDIQGVHLVLLLGGGS